MINRVFLGLRKVILRNFGKFTGKQTSVPEPLFNKVAHVRLERDSGTGIFL